MRSRKKIVLNGVVVHMGLQLVEWYNMPGNNAFCGT